MVSDPVTALVSGWGTVSSGGEQSKVLLATNVTTISHALCDKVRNIQLKKKIIFCGFRCMEVT